MIRFVWAHAGHADWRRAACRVRTGHRELGDDVPLVGFSVGSAIVRRHLYG
ncbi:MAG: hypothetical protein PHT19_16070 [Methylococcus sp.]|nr:hypothetical protein [Methylococcus sp.]